MAECEDHVSHWSAGPLVHGDAFGRLRRRAAATMSDITPQSRRIAYDASLDEVVDAHVKYARRLPRLQRWRVSCSILTGILSGGIMCVVIPWPDSVVVAGLTSV